MRDGQIPPRWAPDFDAGRGTAFFEFTPPLLLTVAEVLHLAGLGFVTSMNLATLFFLELAALLMFLFVRDVHGERAAIVAAVAFVFAPYVMLDLYVRHAYLEVSSLPWLPLATWGAARRSIRLTSIGIGLLLLSHPAIAAFFVPGLLVYAWSRDSLRESAIGVAAGVGLAAWFFIPAVVESQYLKAGDVLANGYLNYANHFVTLRQMIWSPWGFGLSVPGPADEMSFRIGIPHLAALVAAAWFVRGRYRIALLTMAAIAIVFALAISKPIWDVVPQIHPIQFPWRALAIVAFVASLALGLVSVQMPRTAIVLCLICGLPLVGPSGFIDVDASQLTPDAIAQQDLQPGTSGIFNPRQSQTRPWSAERITAASGSLRVVSVSERTARMDAVLETDAPAVARVNVNWFPGWRARLDGTDVPIRVTGADTLIDIPAGTHQLETMFGVTSLRWICLALSIAAVAFIAFAPRLIASAALRAP